MKIEIQQIYASGIYFSVEYESGVVDGNTTHYVSGSRGLKKHIKRAKELGEDVEFPNKDKFRHAIRDLSRAIKLIENTKNIK